MFCCRKKSRSAPHLGAAPHPMSLDSSKKHERPRPPDSTPRLLNLPHGPTHGPEEAHRPAIVIYNGSEWTHAGWMGDEGSLVTLPTLVGRPIVKGKELEEYYIGQEAEEKAGLLNLSRPIEDGIIENFEDMEILWDHIFTKKLNVDPKDQPVLLTESIWNPGTNRQQMAIKMFETFAVPQLSIRLDAELELLASGKTTGVVVQLNDDVTNIVPIIGGRYLPFATLRMDMAGKDLTDYLQKLLAERGLRLTTSAETQAVKGIKEQLCYVALDFNAELTAATKGSIQDVQYEMPDESKITVGIERFRCPEALFDPSLINKKIGGIHELTFQAIMKCGDKPPFVLGMGQDVYSPKRAYDAIPMCDSTNNTATKDLLANIVLTGDSPVLRGLSERLAKELAKLAPNHLQNSVNVVVPSETKSLAWIGGSLWASSSQSTWITRKKYDDCGPTIVQSDCTIPLLPGDFPSEGQYWDYMGTLGSKELLAAACSAYPQQPNCLKQA